MATSEELIAKAKACIDWYWQHGILRTDPRYEVSRGSWLDAVYRCLHDGQGIAAAETAAKPCMALWGPSQTGKSTLLSSYLDEPDDDEGHCSALKWSDDSPVRFVIGRNKSASITVLNPFNFGSDASGCVSRFTLRETVPDPSHPVEVVLATEQQILHALAVGYLSECKPRNAKGEATDWNSDSFTALLAAQKPAGPPQRKAYEFLVQLAGSLDLLIMSEPTRYSNLSENWAKYLRPKMLSCAGLLSNVEQVEAFAFEVLWDNWPSITKTYRGLAAKRGELVSQWGEGVTVRCSYRVAALLLDIDSFKKGSEDQETRARIDALKSQKNGSVVTLSLEGSGKRLVRDVDDFGWLQGLVWELHFSLRKAVLSARAPALTAFFETSDLMDFPGVANDYGSAEKHNDAKVSASPLIALTEVLKRGKTSSVVVTRARNLDIDGFSLLMRLGNFPAQPRQLVSGIKSWLEAYGHGVPPQGKVMPINLVMTFCAKLVNQVVQSGTRQGLQPCFDQLKSLGWLAHPRSVSAIATTYPQFTEGRIDGSDADKTEALESILGDSAFVERFGDSAQSFREMFANGGTDYFFRQLGAQARQSRRVAILADRLAKLQAQMAQLVEQHVPGEVAAAEERNRALDAWCTGMKERLRDRSGSSVEPDAITRLSAKLRRFLNVNPEELEDIPPNAIRSRLPIKTFIEKQFRTWQSARANSENLNAIGIKDGPEAQRLLSYLLEVTDFAAIEQFFRENLGHLSARTDCKQSRRYLAACMSNELLRIPGSASVHRGIASSTQLLNQMASAEEANDTDPQSSPHFLAVIAPLIARIEAVKSTSLEGRPSQPGDSELCQIALLP